MGVIEAVEENLDNYLEDAKECQQLLKDYDGKHVAPKEVQEKVVLTLRNHFHRNIGKKNKGILQGEELEEYLVIVRECLKKISNRYITVDEGVHRRERLSHALCSAFLRMKYEQDLSTFYIKNNQIFCGSEGMNQTDGYVPVLRSDIVDFICQKGGTEGDSAQTSGRGIWRLDGSVDQFFLHGALTFHVLLDGKELEYGTCERLAQKEFFGQIMSRRMTFYVEIPAELLKEESKLEFVLEDRQGERMVLPIVGLDYQCRLTSHLEKAYWCFDSYMMTFDRDKKKHTCGFRFQKTDEKQIKAREKAYMKEILTAPYGSKRMFVIRLMYWLTYSHYADKNIWLTFDKLYKGGDCGEYFYKYMEKHGKKDGITPVYVIRKDVPDYKRLRKEGYHPTPYRTLRQELLYLHASMIFATHSSVHSFCGFSRWNVRFVQDLLHGANTCIQHGLSVQDLSLDSNRAVNNNKRYYCASRYEVENLSRPVYGYGSDVLKLTGIPRYDGLINRDKKQILITPTWRSYIAMPAVMGQARPYNPDFKDTDYYKIYQALLENKKLSEVASRCGYKVIYLLHPVISSQKEDFRPANDIEIISAVDVNYEKILTESSLMVTDYSGVQFDFAYMRKPVVYFHPPKLPPHYEEGGFFYDTQGFGEICREIDELVEVLCGYMESGCRLKDFYRARQDDFFTFDDHENCRRIYEDGKQYQEEFGRS